MSDYLNDRTGTPDPEVQRLESALRPHRWRKRPSPVPALAIATIAMAAAASVLLAVAWGLSGPSEPGGWSSVTAACTGCTWEIGDTLDTTEGAKARIADRGSVVAAQGAVLTRLDSDTGARFRLERGTIDVEVDAPPEWLVIETPGVEVVDLGCAYTLTVDEQGKGGIIVRSGAVALVGDTRTEVLAGSAAATWDSGYTGLPVRVDAPVELVRAVDAWDSGASDDVMPLCQAAGPEDLTTLFHLLGRLERDELRAKVVDSLLELVPGEAPVDRDALIAGDESEMDELHGLLIGLW